MEDPAGRIKSGCWKLKNEKTRTTENIANSRLLIPNFFIEKYFPIMIIYMALKFSPKIEFYIKAYWLLKTRMNFNVMS